MKMCTHLSSYVYIIKLFLLKLARGGSLVWNLFG